MVLTKKPVDTWRTKSWYAVIAPKFLGEVEVAQVPASDEQHLVNRVITLPLREVTHDLSHMYVNIRLRVSEIRGRTAFTKFIGHEISREYLSTLVRRHRDALRVVLPVKSADGIDFTVKALAVTNSPCSAMQKSLLRNALASEMKKKVAKQEFGKFIQEVLWGKAGTELYGKLRKLVPLRRVEVYKTELYEEFDVAEVQSLENMGDEGAGETEGEPTGETVEAAESVPTSA
ncbi:hypothetical protein H0N96_01170 [Candidatus Micrarchaeota archaeon]|nr:hypothetical protein [Candidatus Micrarchaeota archaeon]